MTEYRVEARTFYSKPSLDKNHIAESSQEEVQALMDTDAGWRLASTDATTFGMALYVYLYFEREV